MQAEASESRSSAVLAPGLQIRRSGEAALPIVADAMRIALEREPANTLVMSNLATVLNDLGRFAEAKRLAQQLAELGRGVVAQLGFLGGELWRLALGKGIW